MCWGLGRGRWVAVLPIRQGLAFLLAAPPAHPPRPTATCRLCAGEDPAAPAWGTLVAPGVNAQFHQHMFSIRIDPAVDDGDGGAGLVVAEVRRRQLAARLLARRLALVPARSHGQHGSTENQSQACCCSARPSRPPRSPLQVDAVAVPKGPDNPAGNAFTVKETDLLSESGTW